jgi:hypothetical protein
MSKEHAQKSGRNTWLGDGIHNNVSLQSWTQSGSRDYWIVESSDDAFLHDVESSSECSPGRRATAASAKHGWMDNSKFHGFGSGMG